MEENHKHFGNAILGGFGSVLAWFGAHGQVINEAVSLFSLYGGAIVVAWSLRNCFRQWRRNRENKD